MPDRFEIKLSDDQSSVLVMEGCDSGPDRTVRLNAQELLALTKLGEAHSDLTADRPVSPLKGQKIEGIFNTVWSVSPELMGEASGLSFFHPFFDQVEQMVALLNDHIKKSKSIQQVPKTRAEGFRPSRSKLL